jgi:hypothetical protein
MHLHTLCGAVVSFASIVCGSAPNGPWDTFNLAPATRVVRPTAIKETSGSVSNGRGLLTEDGRATLSGNESWLTLDFGKEVSTMRMPSTCTILILIQVGGLISMTFGNVSEDSSLALSFTESPMFISPLKSDDSTYPSPNMSYDGVLEVAAPLREGFWTQPSSRLRGGFRYLTLVSTSSGPVTVSNVTCAISFMPHVDDMRNYSGYFYASDPVSPVSQDRDFLTKVSS